MNLYQSFNVNNLQKRVLSAHSLKHFQDFSLAALWASYDFRFTWVITGGHLLGRYTLWFHFRMSGRIWRREILHFPQLSMWSSCCLCFLKVSTNVFLCHCGLIYGCHQRYVDLCFGLNIFCSVLNHTMFLAILKLKISIKQFCHIQIFSYLHSHICTKISDWNNRSERLQKILSVFPWFHMLVNVFSMKNSSRRFMTIFTEEKFTLTDFSSASSTPRIIALYSLELLRFLNSVATSNSGSSRDVKKQEKYADFHYSITMFGWLNGSAGVSLWDGSTRVVVENSVSLQWQKRLSCSSMLPTNAKLERGVRIFKLSINVYAHLSLHLLWKISGTSYKSRKCFETTDLWGYVA